MRRRGPACGVPGAFAGAYRLRRACERRGVAFERRPASFLGATVLAYIVAMAAMAAMAVVAIAPVPGRGLDPGLEAALVAGATGTVLLLHWPTMGGWSWAIWAALWVHRDGDDPERPRPT